MIDKLKTRPVYVAIPPTTDLEYWQVKTSSDGKTKVFMPLDTELHRALLIEQRNSRPVVREWPTRKRHDPRFRKA